MPFVDIDLLIEKAAGISYRQFWKEEGEGAYRRLERMVILTLKPEAPSVIATGGGSIVDPANVSDLKKLGPLIHLHVEWEALQERFPSASELRYLHRKGIYKKVADMSINTTARTAEQVVDHLMRWHGKQ